jgi:hypothetical protein
VCWSDLVFANGTLVDRIAAGDDRRVGFSEREVRQIVDMRVEGRREHFPGVGAHRRAVADVAGRGLVELGTVDPCPFGGKARFAGGGCGSMRR